MLSEWIETHDRDGTRYAHQFPSTVADVSWLRIESEEKIRRIVLDRPERKNAVPAGGWADLARAFEEFEDSDDRVLIVTGAGGDFCAGADLADTGLPGVADGHRRMKVVSRAAMALHRLTKPTIAAVDGVAVGAGMNLALGCDVVIASDRVRFSEIFVKRGLTVDFGGSWLLPRIVGLQRAKELALSGRIVEADEAVGIGLAVETVEPERLDERATEMAKSFLAGAPVGQMFAKQAINASFESSLADALSFEGQSQAIAFGTSDLVEGVSAFLEKRDPNWTGR